LRCTPRVPSPNFFSRVCPWLIAVGPGTRMMALASSRFKSDLIGPRPLPPGSVNPSPPATSSFYSGIGVSPLAYCDCFPSLADISRVWYMTPATSVICTSPRECSPLPSTLPPSSPNSTIEAQATSRSFPWSLPPAPPFGPTKYFLNLSLSSFRKQLGGRELQLLRRLLNHLS